MIILNPQNFIQIFGWHGYPVKREEPFKPYHLNIVGFRNISSRVNYFDDTISVIYEKNKEWIKEDFKATTYPGTPSLLKPINEKGSAILKPGQYTYRKGKHKGRYDALVQKGPVTVYRDNNKDLVYNLNIAEETGYFGINIHKASLGAKLVGPNSHGCQVIKSGFDRFMELIDLSLMFRENSFVYSLVEI